MPATDLISPFVVSCAGGLTLNKDVFSMQPGEALILQNFEYCYIIKVLRVVSNLKTISIVNLRKSEF